MARKTSQAAKEGAATRKKDAAASHKAAVTASPKKAAPAKKGSATESASKKSVSKGKRDGATTGKYTAKQITVLEGLEAVRQRPAMYIGDTGARGLHHLFNEVLDNSIDEALAGHCDRIVCTLHEDNSLSVQDNGRGIPVDLHEKYGVSALQVVMCTLHAGGKFGGGGYRVSGGLHGVGVSCVNALSEWCEVTVERDGYRWHQRYVRGKPEALVKRGEKTNKTGTYTRWSADPEVFETLTYEPRRLKERMRELAYLNAGVTLTFVNEQNPDDNETFHFKKGIQALVEDLNEAHNPLHKPIFLKKSRDDVDVEVAIQYHSGYAETVLSFANNINTVEGGTHTTGSKTALTRVINQYARKSGQLKEKDPNFTGDDVRGGLTMVLSVKLLHPQFEGQTKTKLGNSEVEGIVNSIVGEGLMEFLEENPPIARRIVEKAIIEQRAREAAKKAAEAVKRSSALDSYGLAAKLADCSEKDPHKAELFIVEGDSAGGNAKSARDRRFQAILPIKGKIINVEKARPDKALDNEEIKALISTIGTGIAMDFGRNGDGDEEGRNGKRESDGFDIGRLRYHKIIILSDADVDGEHIRTLLLTFFYRYMRPLVEGGFVYLALPPLFTIKAGKDDVLYAQTEKERDEILKDLRRRRKDIQITRFKGLGEMNADQLEDTVMNPARRNLIQIRLHPEDATEAEMVFTKLMGDKVEPRREFIEAHAKEATDLDWHY
ncbi:MAG: DNA gyrase subunit B [Armatimonadota bacterium]